jgi:hypothetical protein
MHASGRCAQRSGVTLLVLVGGEAVTELACGPPTGYYVTDVHEFVIAS